MMDGVSSPERSPLPPWGQKARRLTKSAWNVFAPLWLLGFLITVIGALVGADKEDLQEIFRDSLPWPCSGGPSRSAVRCRSFWS